jgi:RND superfamily putative drug exporter
VQRFAAVVMRHRVLVALLWVVITVVGALMAPHLSSRLQSGTTLNTASYTANATLQREYGVSANPSVLVIDLPDGTTADSPATRAALTAAHHVAVRVPGVHDLSYASTGDPALWPTAARRR